MPRLTGIFSNFVDLDNLSAQDLHPWLRAKEEAFYLENFIGNRILYPQTVASSINDLEIDLAILRECIKKNPQFIYSEKLKKLVIPEELIVRFPPVQKLISALLDVLSLTPITPIMLKNFNGGVENAGTIVSIFYKEGEAFFDVNVNGQLLKLEFNSTTILPSSDKNIAVQIDSQPALNVAGGSIGLVIDIRKVLA